MCETLSVVFQSNTLENHAQIENCQCLVNQDYRKLAIHIAVQKPDAGQIVLIVMKIVIAKDQSQKVAIAPKNALSVYIGMENISTPCGRFIAVAADTVAMVRA